MIGTLHASKVIHYTVNNYVQIKMSERKLVLLFLKATQIPSCDISYQLVCWEFHKFMEQLHGARCGGWSQRGKKSVSSAKAVLLFILKSAHPPQFTVCCSFTPTQTPYTSTNTHIHLDMHMQAQTHWGKAEFLLFSSQYWIAQEIKSIVRDFWVFAFTIQSQNPQWFLALHFFSYRYLVSNMLSLVYLFRRRKKGHRHSDSLLNLIYTFLNFELHLISLQLF